MFLGFNYDSPSLKKYLTGPLEKLRYWQTQLIPEGLCDVAMERVHKRFLDIGVDVKRYPVSPEAENVVARKQTAAKHQPAVSERHLIIEQYLERANNHVDQGRREQGVLDYTEAIRLKPTYALAYHYRGIAHRDRGDPNRALADLNEAINLEPEYAQAINDRGTVHLSQGNFVGAVVDFETALGIDPHLADAERNLYLARQRR
jgi:tetratricopeptide (TPR) repeat protein